MRRALFGLCVVLILTGCDRSSTTEHLTLPPRYDTGADVRDALKSSGLGCDDFQPISPVHRDLGEKDALETYSCRIDNQDAVISIWKGLGQKQDWARQRAMQGCQFAESLGTAAPVYVDGARWTVTVESKMLADRISHAIGGQARATDCSSLD